MEESAMIKGGWRDPAEILAAYAEEPWTLALLSDGKGEQGRWSYLARHPDAVLVVKAGDPGDPFAALAELIGPVRGNERGGPPFQCGVAGFASYELGDRTERLGLARNGDWPDLACAHYPAVLAFDHLHREVIAIGRGENEYEHLNHAHEAMEWLKAEPSHPRRGPLAGPITASSGVAYEAAVRNVTGRIAAGEIFQANVARFWTGALTEGATPGDVAVRLRRASPAPFAAYLRLEDRALVSNSPERFLRVSPDGEALIAESRPIKGTAPRGADAAKDKDLAAGLTASQKDRAENLMIVDLMRNDLARVCDAGTVTTPELFRVESFANVHHLVSTVRGRLAEGRTAVDLLRAAFPPGSITGAPKIQAMKVIASLEPPRGPFFGAMFWAGCDGAFDSSVLIRTAAFEQTSEGWSVEARAGAGLVADSDARAERMETEDKIGALLAALTGEGG